MNVRRAVLLHAVRVHDPQGGVRGDARHLPHHVPDVRVISLGFAFY